MLNGYARTPCAWKSMMSDMLDIDSAWDCDSIEEMQRYLREALNYSGDFMSEIKEKLDILERRKTELGC